MIAIRALSLPFALTVALAVSGCAMMAKSSEVSLTGKLSAANEVPAVNSAAAGTLEGSFNKETSQLKWRVVYSGLSGPATAAHFHGPAAAGQNAGVALGFKSAESPIQGEATLTPAQAGDLLAGRWYVNVHSRAHPAGEIRAQVTVTH